MKAIKNIIFDLGGVLLNVDYENTSEAFKKLGASDFDNFYSQQAANHLFEALETGQLTEAAFYAAMSEHCHPGTTIAEMEAAWNAILLDFRTESLQTLDHLKDRYQLYLLSNTNSIHLTAFEKIYTRQTGRLRFDHFFKKAYYSHIMQKRKPYPATYQFVLEDAGILAADTLFIDDSKVNIDGAIAAGLKTHWLVEGQKIEHLDL